MKERAGDFSEACPEPGNSYTDCPIVPGFLDSTGHTPNLNVVPAFVANRAITQPLLAMIPQPNGSDGTLGSALDTWFATPTLPTYWRQELFRIDQNVTDKVCVSYNYIHDSWQQQYPVPLWTSGTSFPTVQTNFTNPGVAMIARITANVTPTLLNEFVAGYTTDHIGTNLTGAWQRPQNYPALGLFDNGFGGKLPGISI